VLEPKYVVAGIKNEPHHYQVNQPPYTQYQPYQPANRSEWQSRLTFEFPMLIPVIVFFALGLSNLLLFLLNQSSCLDEEVPQRSTPLRFRLLLDAIVKLTLAFLIAVSLLLAIFKEGFKDMLTNIWIIITILFIAY
jgi:phosphoglycerol transferase MdoB-like AlkP superfamily enzyme